MGLGMMAKDTILACQYEVIAVAVLSYSYTMGCPPQSGASDHGLMGESFQD